MPLMVRYLTVDSNDMNGDMGMVTWPMFSCFWSKPERSALVATSSMHLAVTYIHLLVPPGHATTP